jgi:hypothetical protein
MVDFAKPPEGHLAFEEDGELFFVPQAQAENWLQSGLRPLNDEDLRKRALKKKYADSSVAPALLGAASGLSFGTAPALLTEAGLLERGEAKAIEAANPMLYTGSDIGAGVLSVLLSGGTGAAARGAVEAGKVGAKQIAKKVLAGAAAPTVKASEVAMGAGRAATKLIPGTGRVADAARTIAPLATAGALEGGLYGAGHAINEAVLKNPEWTAEDILSSSFSGFAQGAALGGAFGGGLAGVGGLAAAGAKGMTDLVGKVYKNATDSDLFEGSVNFLSKALYGGEAERGGAVSDVFLRAFQNSDELRRTLDDYNRVATQIADTQAQGKTVSEGLKKEARAIRLRVSEISSRLQGEKNLYNQAIDDIKKRSTQIDDEFGNQLNLDINKLSEQVQEAAELAEKNMIDLSRPIRGEGDELNPRQQFYVEQFEAEPFVRDLTNSETALENLLALPRELRGLVSEAKSALNKVDSDVLNTMPGATRQAFGELRSLVTGLENRFKDLAGKTTERYLNRVVVDPAAAQKAMPTADEVSRLFEDIVRFKAATSNVLYRSRRADLVLRGGQSELAEIRDSLVRMSQNADIFPKKVVDFEIKINNAMSDVIATRKNVYQKISENLPENTMFGVFGSKVNPEKLKKLIQTKDFDRNTLIELDQLQSYLNALDKVEGVMNEFGVKSGREAHQAAFNATRTADAIKELFDLRAAVRAASKIDDLSDALLKIDEMIGPEISEAHAKAVQGLIDDLKPLSTAGSSIRKRDKLVKRLSQKASLKRDRAGVESDIMEDRIARFQAEQDPSLRAMMDFRSRRPSSWEGFALADLIVDIPFVPDIVSGGILLASRPQAMMHTILGAQKVASVTANLIRGGANKVLKGITLGERGFYPTVAKQVKKKSVLGHSLGKIAGISALPGQEPDLKNYDKSVERLNELTSNPEELENYLEDVGNTAKGMPTVKQNMIQTSQRAIQYLQAIQPQPSMGGVFDPFPPEPTMDQKIKYATAISVINDPIGAYYYALGNNLLSEEVLAPLKAIYPQLATRLEGQVIDTFSEAKKPIPYSMRVQMALVYGPGMDLTVAPQFVGAMQQMYTSPGQEQGGGVNMTQGGVGQLRKSAAAFQTPGQRMMEA